MKHFSIIFYITIIFSLNCHAVTPQEVAQVTAEHYAHGKIEELIYKKIAAFLDKNPQVILSEDPAAGTKAVAFVQNAIGVHRLLTAENDNQRFRALVQLYATNTTEPTSKLAAYLILVGDTLMRLEHHRYLAEIYAAIAEIEMKTTESLSAVYVNRYNTQIRFIQRFSAAVDSLNTVQTALESNPFYSFVTQAHSIENQIVPDQNDLEQAISLLFKMESSLLELKASILFLDLVEYQALGEDPEIPQLAQSYMNKYDSTLKSMSGTKELYIKAYSSMVRDERIQALNNSLFSHTATLRTYRACTQYINKRSQTLRRSHLVSESQEGGFLNECHLRFGFTFGAPNDETI